MATLAWAASYSDRTITGCLPEDLPGASVPRQGLKRFELMQGDQDSGWTRILDIDLADHERLIFRRTMAISLLAQAGGPRALRLILGVYDTITDRYSLIYLNGDGSISLKADTADILIEPHEVG